MQFYSGFSLKNDEHFFAPFIKKSDCTVCGFSYGAIKAFQSVQKSLLEGRRVDTLQLFSPAFFQSKDEKFKRLQLMAYRKNEDAYLAQFINACFLPHQRREVEHDITLIEDLEELLSYEWSFEALRALDKQGVVIEVYLGAEDHIVDVDAAKDFFKELATVTYIKNANHFLLTE
jgi:surfactin synthase thioesterase subunit